MPLPRLRDEVLIERTTFVCGGCAGKARARAAGCVSRQRELRYDKQGATDVSQRTVHLAGVIFAVKTHGPEPVAKQLPIA
jgi:hypothetical protein